MKDRKSLTKIALPLEPAELVRDWQENIRDMQKRGRSVRK